MGYKNKSLKSFFITFVVVLVFGIVGSSLLKDYKQKKYPEKFVDESVAVETDYNVFPQIVNVPSRSVELGDEFTFNPRIIPSENNVKLNLLNGPDWMFFDGTRVFGTPTEVETVSFILRLEQGGEYVDREFYLVVTENVDE